jgi:hypothetical protein
VDDRRGEPSSAQDARNGLAFRPWRRSPSSAATGSD